MPSTRFLAGICYSFFQQMFHCLSGCSGCPFYQLFLIFLNSRFIYWLLWAISINLHYSLLNSNHPYDWNIWIFPLVYFLRKCSFFHKEHYDCTLCRHLQWVWLSYWIFWPSLFLQRYLANILHRLFCLIIEYSFIDWLMNQKATCQDFWYLVCFLDWIQFLLVYVSTNALSYCR